MRSTLARYGVVTALLAGSASATAQQTSSPKSDDRNANKKEVTLVGCVEPEKDYRARLSAAKGGPLASGVGQSNEYVLSSAKPMPANGAELTPKEAVATSGQSGDYLLTGKPETELKQAIGRQVHIVGTVAPFPANESAKDARDRLPRLTISTWHQVGDFCPGK
jgi:hypothetical protein